MKRLTSAFLICTIAQALVDLRPGAQWVMYGDVYSGLQWMDKTQTQPTKNEVDTYIAACQALANGPQPLPLDQRISNLEMAVNQLSQAANVPVSLPTTSSVGPKKITGL